MTNDHLKGNRTNHPTRQLETDPATGKVKCPRCQEWKYHDTRDFYKDTSRATGLSFYCSKCKKEMQRRTNSKNSTKTKELTDLQAKVRWVERRLHKWLNSTDQYQISKAMREELDWNPNWPQQEQKQKQNNSDPDSSKEFFEKWIANLTEEDLKAITYNPNTDTTP